MTFPEIRIKLIFQNITYEGIAYPFDGAIMPHGYPSHFDILFNNGFADHLIRSEYSWHWQNNSANNSLAVCIGEYIVDHYEGKKIWNDEL